MNFSAGEDTISKEKNKYSNFFSRFYKNPVFLIIFLFTIIFSGISVSIWLKSPGYQLLYNHLSNEDSVAIVHQLNDMQIPYQFTEDSGKLLVPADKIYEIRLLLAEHNLPRSGGIGFEILDQEKFGISQFNENIHYQRALEGELARTIQRINAIKYARIHIAFPKSSLFLQDRKEPSASIIVDLHPGSILNSNQTNAILHLIANSVSGLSIDNITIVDQSGKLLNHPGLEYNQINDLQLKYIQSIEERYTNRIKNILEPLLGSGNIYAQVTAQVDFNTQERTKEEYEPNTSSRNQSVRSNQVSIHNEIDRGETNEGMPSSFSSVSPVDRDTKEKISPIENANVSSDKKQKNYIASSPFSNKLDSHHENTVNYELNHTILHTKVNIGEIKRLSAAVVVNFIQDKNDKLISLTSQQKNNIENLVREAIGYSKDRGDSINVVNSIFFKNNKKYDNKILSSNICVNHLEFLDYVYSLLPWCFLLLIVLFLLKKYTCIAAKKTDISAKQIKKDVKKNVEKKIKTNVNQKNIQENLNTDQLIHQICNISNQNPRTIALIIRQWMSDKI